MLPKGRLERRQQRSILSTPKASAPPPHDTASDGFVLSHLSDKNKDVAKVGHPKSVVRARNSLSASEAAQNDKADLDSCPPTLSAVHHPTDEDLSVGTPGSGKDGARRFVITRRFVVASAVILGRNSHRAGCSG